MPLLPPQLRGEEVARAGVVLNALTVVAAWVMLHTSYAIYYAQQDYRSGAGCSSLGGEAPTRRDFAYVAFAIGTIFAAPDVEITGRHTRRTALGHGVLSFGYNTTVLALVINLLLGGGV